MARFVDVNGCRFAVRSWGAPPGPLALLVHGFPDTSATWRHLGPRLAAAGYHVVAPWTRGYAPTSLPPDGDVRLSTLASDLNGLHAAVGGDGRAVLVGHDWGAAAAYRAAAVAPQHWDRLVTLALPPEPALVGLFRAPRQWRRSWYALAAQLPLERLPFDHVFDGLVGLWRRWSPGYEPTAEDLDNLRASLSAPGSLAAALAYYRGQRHRAREGPSGLRRAPVPARPTLYLHGVDDGCVGPEWVPSADAVLRAAHPASRAELVAARGHFLHLEDPDEIGGRVEAWLQG